MSVRGTVAPVVRIGGVLALLVIIVFGAARSSLTAGVATAGAGARTTGGRVDPLPWAVLAAVAVGLLLVLLWRRRRRGSEEPAHEDVLLPPTRLQRMVALAVALVTTGLLGVAIWQAFRLIRPPGGVAAHSSPSPVVAPVTGSAPPADGVSGTVFLALGAAALAVMVAVAVTVLVRRRRRGPTSPTAVGGPTGMAEAVAAGRSALRATEDDRAAILACYAAMEQSLAEHGIARRSADTPSEHLRRAAEAGVARTEAVAGLLALFHRARFSDHPVHPADRQTAERALAAVSGELAEIR